jgi:ribosome-associated protein
MIEVTAAFAIPEDAVEESFIRSSGPGGQNVNKVSSAVQLRVDLARVPWLHEAARRRLAGLAGRRLTEDGILLIDARQFRSQDRNRAEARERVAELMRAALVAPRKRRATRPTRASKVERLAAKRQRAGVKQGRGRVRPDD